jgi:predicted HTH domain antitoxin
MTKSKIESQVENVKDQSEDVLEKDDLIFTNEEEYNDGDNDLLTTEKYDIPVDADVFIDTKGGDVTKKEDMTPWEIIKSMAQHNKVSIREPNNGCIHCYGRGFEGLDSKTKMPIPCRCIFRGRTEEQKNKESYFNSSIPKRISREQKRNMSKFIHKVFQNKRKEESKRAIDGLPPRQYNETNETEESSNREINLVLKEYIKNDSLKKTALSMKMTLTKVKHIVKENKEKLEKLKESKNEQKATKL